MLGGDSATLLFGRFRGLLLLNADGVEEVLNALFSPLDLPEFLWFAGLDAIPVLAFGELLSEFLDLLSGDSEGDAQFFFLHMLISDELFDRCQALSKMVREAGLEPASRVATDFKSVVCADSTTPASLQTISICFIFVNSGTAGT